MLWHIHTYRYLCIYDMKYSFFDISTCLMSPLFCEVTSAILVGAGLCPYDIKQCALLVTWHALALSSKLHCFNPLLHGHKEADLSPLLFQLQTAGPVPLGASHHIHHRDQTAQQWPRLPLSGCCLCLGLPCE